jgi:general secretion pathway protein E
MGLQSSKNAEMVLSEEAIMRALASHWRLPFLRIDVAKLDPVMIRSNIPEAVAVKHRTIPVSLSDNTLVIAIVNPLDVDALEALKQVSPFKIHLAISIKVDIQKAIERCYSMRGGTTVTEKEEADEATRKFEDFFTSAADEYTDQRIVDAVNLLVHYAIEQRSTEIQMKPKEEHCMIQFRIDSILYDVKRIPLEIYENMLGRLKSLAGIKTSDRPPLQEGRTQFKFHNRVFRLEMSIIPIVFGEKVIIRILDSLQLFRHVYDLGLTM